MTNKVIIISPNSLMPNINCGLIAALSSRLHVVMPESIDIDINGARLEDSLKEIAESRTIVELPAQKKTAYERRNCNEPWYRKQRKKR